LFQFLDLPGIGETVGKMIMSGVAEDQTAAAGMEAVGILTTAPIRVVGTAVIGVEEDQTAAVGTSAAVLTAGAGILGVGVTVEAGILAAVTVGAGKEGRWAVVSLVSRLSVSSSGLSNWFHPHLRIFLSLHRAARLFYDPISERLRKLLLRLSLSEEKQ